eukprot:TRINITY_DN60718_c0_g1_i1.p1 TRINITY_DN60718_c0_g1~~TRINITY_DN60718_c0_g1_i1.p1  ORF type:complete len:347 (-),score=46.75 TRINITY_DN60718_c0_g1_i1:114-1154(-)
MALKMCIALIVAVSFVPGAIAEQGFINRSSDGKFLTCNNHQCSWEPNPTQIFRKDQGNNGQYRFHIMQMDSSGTTTDTDQCLDREHCHKGSSNARMAECNHCGAVHWNFDASSHRLAEDSMENCIQSDGNIGHCRGTHETINWPVEQDCKPIQTTITDLECINQQSGGECGADFEQDSVAGAHSEDDCDACQAANGSTQECSFSFGIQTQNTISTTFSSSQSIMVGTEFTLGWDFLAKAELTVKFSITDTLTYGQSKTKSSTTTATGGCSATIKAGTRESARANYVSGTLRARFKGKVTTKYDCPWKGDTSEQTTGTIQISNVPTQSMEGTCKAIASPCPESIFLI